MFDGLKIPKLSMGYQKNSLYIVECLNNFQHISWFTGCLQHQRIKLLRDSVRLKRRYGLLWRMFENTVPTCELNIYIYISIVKVDV